MSNDLRFYRVTVSRVMDVYAESHEKAIEMVRDMDITPVTVPQWSAVEVELPNEATPL